MILAMIQCAPAIRERLIAAATPVEGGWDVPDALLQEYGLMPPLMPGRVDAKEVISRARRGEAITAAEWDTLPGWMRNRIGRPEEKAESRKQKAETQSMLAIANLRRPICEKCERFRGPAGDLSVHCGCLGKRDCSNIVRLDQVCPEGKWDSVALPTYFDRVVVISLKRTPDRLRAFRDRLSRIDWPFPEPTVFDAVDGAKLPVPNWWKEGGPAWGCLSSHRQAIEQALRDGVSRLLILEDDADFPIDARARLRAFLSAVPADWMCLMIGGQQMADGFVRSIAPGVARVSQCERTHCYALSADGMRSLYRWWSEPVSGHCDWRLGDWQALSEVKCYRPDPIIAMQAGNFSTIRYRQEPARSWDSRVKVTGRQAADVRIFVLDCPRRVVEAARSEGIVHSGYWLTAEGVDHELAKHASDPGYLDRWLSIVRAEAAAFLKAVVVIWMPDCEIKAEATRRFKVLKAETIDALRREIQ